MNLAQQLYCTRNACSSIAVSRSQNAPASLLASTLSPCYTFRISRCALYSAPFYVWTMRTVFWNADIPAVQMIDQRLLPGEMKILDLPRPEDVAFAIKDMAVRGAPAIGATAAFGIALAAVTADSVTTLSLLAEVQRSAQTLRAARPTAVNLAWAIDRMLHIARENENLGPDELRQLLVHEAQKLADEDVDINRRMAVNGAALIQSGDTVIHHCNTGALATVDHGTALGVIRTAHEQGKSLHVLVDETRPRLQGARLTAWELDQYGISHDIITDNAAGYFLRFGTVAAVFVGADRVAANGDVANKIGTYMLALAAKDNEVPFYVVAPTSTIDLQISTGADIPIEERSPEEVLNLTRAGQPIAPAGSTARNPAFDITPYRLVSAIVTEVGVLRPPYLQTIEKALKEV